MEKNNYGEIFSRRLRALRKELGFTVEDFANKVDVSKSSIGYYENQNRVPDIITVARMADELNVSVDYLIGRSNARTNKISIKRVCEKIGLSDKSVLMLARLKKEKSIRLQTINLLLEQADEDIDIDYKFEGKYEGSVLNAICRYLDRYKSFEDYLSEEISDCCGDGITSSIREALYQLFLNQVTDALKDFYYNNIANIIDHLPYC